MEKSQSLKDCYDVLNINIDCNWDDLKKSYRRLIQKCHPDRFKDENDKEVATKKLKDLNIAYKQLSNYYRKHGTLPLSIPAPTEHNKNQSNRKKDTVPPAKKQPLQTQRKKTLPLVLIIIFIPVTGIFIYPNLDSIVISFYDLFESQDKYQATKNKEPKKSNPVTSTYKTDEISPYQDSFGNEQLTNTLKKENKFFTYGSTIGEVILIQGPPEKIEGEIWYYGESEVHFKDGLVIDWFRNSNNPLKALALPEPSKETDEN